MSLNKVFVNCFYAKLKFSTRVTIYYTFVSESENLLKIIFFEVANFLKVTSRNAIFYDNQLNSQILSDLRLTILL